MNRTQKALGLTDSQWEILEHRLEVPDCIADALCDFDGWPYWREDVEECAAALLAGENDLEMFNVLFGDDITHAVLAEAVEGSTWMGGAYGEADHTGDHLKAARAYRSGKALASKIGEYVGRKVTFPDC